MSRLLAASLIVCILAPSFAGDAKAPQGTPWKCHTIDNTSKGADGVRPMDVNRDGLMDLVVGWEEGGVVRAYLNPGPAKATLVWPMVTVGNVKSPEDAVFVDLDGDGAVDVVSCCEGGVRSVFVHWAPREKDQYLDAKAWKTEAIPAVKDMCQWMFCLPMQIDGKHGVDLVVGGKNKGGVIGWLEAPADPRQLDQWKWHALKEAGWIMSLEKADMDQDGDEDVIVSDRRGPGRGVFWLENPGPGEAQIQPWPVHNIGSQGQEVMFLDLADLDGDGLLDVIVPTVNRRLFVHQRKDAKKNAWHTWEIDFPSGVASGKAVRVVDIDGDGKKDIILSCGNGEPGHILSWLAYRKDVTDRIWDCHDISGHSGKKGGKPDLIVLLDLDGDGDLDVITTEERGGLGVVWYENPGRKK